MPSHEDLIRSIVRSIVEEGLEGFKQKTSKIHYAGSHEDSTFERNPTQRKLARSVKQAFSEESDQNFFRTLHKIHWVRLAEPPSVKKISWFLRGGGRNEISTSGYSANTSDFDSFWGDIGIELQGRVTLAHNDMDDIYSGYSANLDPAVQAKYASSGVPKRASIFTPLQAQGYILDEESFEGGDSNEMIVDNWKPVAIWISAKGFKGLRDWSYLKNPEDNKMWASRMATLASSTSLKNWFEYFLKVYPTIIESGLPIFLTNGEKVSSKEISEIVEKIKNLNN